MTKEKFILLLLSQIIYFSTLTAQYKLWLGRSEDFNEPPLIPQDEIKHVKVRVAELPNTFLIGCAIAEHKGVLYASWASGPEGIRENGPLEHVKVKRSFDKGLTWQDETILAPVVDGPLNHSHGSFWSINDTLNFFSASYAGHTRGYINGQRIFSTELTTVRFYLEEITQTWVSKGSVIDNFVPMDEPRKLPNGNFLMSGIDKDMKDRVAISKGDNTKKWKTVSVPQDYTKGFPEPSTLVLEDKIFLIIRNYSRVDDSEHFCISVSKDNGESWTPIELTNFLATQSKPYSGVLSNGIPFLVSNLKNRKWICLSIGKIGEQGFSKIFRIRPGEAPFPTYFKGGIGSRKQQWSYPYCIEYDDKLFIIYHQGKLDAELTIVPIQTLENL